LESRVVALYGRRLYELMNAYWPTAESDPAATGVMLEFARIWNAKPKVVVSSTMQEAPTGWRLTSGRSRSSNGLRRQPTAMPAARRTARTMPS
jgi:hypothetical protein